MTADAGRHLQLSRSLDLFATLRGVLLAVVVLLAVTVAVVAVRRFSRGYLERRATALTRRSRPLLLEILAAESPDDSVVEAVAALPEREWRLAEATAVSMLGKVSGEARLALVRVLERRGTLDRAERATRARSWVRRCRAAEMLGAAGSPRSTRVLLPLLTDRRGEVRRVTARALGRIGSGDAAGELLRACSGPRRLPSRDVAHALVLLEPRATAEIMAAATGSPDPTVRAVIAEALGLRGAVEAVPLLAGLLAATEPLEVRIRAARALGRIGARAGVGALAACLADGAVELRAVAARALGQIGSEDAVTPLTACLQDPSHRVAANAAESLAAVGERGVAALRSLLASPSPRVAGYAAEALAMHALGRPRLEREGV